MQVSERPAHSPPGPSSHLMLENTAIVISPRTSQPEADSSTIEEGSSSLLDLTGQIVREHVYPSAFGGFADVWTGTWTSKSGPCKVIVLLCSSGHSFLIISFSGCYKSSSIVIVLSRHSFLIILFPGRYKSSSIHHGVPRSKSKNRQGNFVFLSVHILSLYNFCMILRSACVESSKSGKDCITKISSHYTELHLTSELTTQWCAPGLRMVI
jgi:hypothetical protein